MHIAPVSDDRKREFMQIIDEFFPVTNWKRNPVGSYTIGPPVAFPSIVVQSRTGDISSSKRLDELVDRVGKVVEQTDNRITVGQGCRITISV